MTRHVYTIGSVAGLLGAIDAVTLPDGGVVITPGPDDPAPPKGTPPKGGGLVNGDGYPAGVTPTKKAWTEDQRYRLQSGDTLSGMARTYLGDPSRWREIWNVQETAIKLGKNPDKLPAGMVLDMPEEAKRMARDLGVLGMDPTLKRALLLGGAVAGAATIGGGLLWALRGKGRRR